jgi:hypothetical protein
MSVAHHPALRSEWSRLDVLLECEILRLRARYQLSLDELRGLYISDEQVDRLVATATGAASPQPVVAPPVRADGTPLARLGAALGLTPVELDLVVVALAPELDLKYETLFAYLNDDVSRRWPTAELAARLLGDGKAGAVREALAPDAPLAKLGVLAPIDPPAGRPSLSNTGFKLAREVVHFLVGLDALSPELSPFVRRSGAEDPDAPVAPAVCRLPDLLREGRARDRPVVILLGPDARGAEAAAAFTARALGRALVCLDLEAARAQNAWPAQAAATVALRLRLRASAVLVAAQGGLERAPEIVTALRALIATGAPIFLACDAESDWRAVARSLRTVTVDLAPADFAARRQLWDAALARAGLDVPAAVAADLADRFAFSAAQVELAVAATLDATRLRDHSPADLPALISRAARGLLDQRLGKLASKVSLAPTWDDLVLPGPTQTRLRELASAVKHRHLVYNEWGFSRRNDTGTGIKALFAGPSGTGKTMTAAVLANELGFDLYRIDLSGIVSKYIGETEKNLDEIFRGARAGQAMLFFDEADALFGKRSEVKDAHDRYANIEVAYLLQKLEQHDGVVILATNLKRNIDDAFARRMHYVIEFPLPDASAREALWQGMFPARVPLGPDVDWAFLARQFALSGGDIRNVALDAAFLAAQNGRVVGMKEVVRATARQMVKQGRLPSSADFQQYHPWIAGGT